MSCRNEPKLYCYGGCPEDQSACCPHRSHPKPCIDVLAFVGVALEHLEGKRGCCETPADVRNARAVRVLSELVTRIEQS